MHDEIIDKLDRNYHLMTLVYNKLESLAPLIHTTDQMLTITETAAHFKVCNRTIGRWKASGAITPRYVGGTVYYFKAELDQAARDNKLNRK